MLKCEGAAGITSEINSCGDFGGNLNYKKHSENGNSLQVILNFARNGFRWLQLTESIKKHARHQAPDQRQTHPACVAPTCFAQLGSVWPPNHRETDEVHSSAALCRTRESCDTATQTIFTPMVWCDALEGGGSECKHAANFKVVEGNERDIEVWKARPWLGRLVLFGRVSDYTSKVFDVADDAVLRRFEFECHETW